MDLRQTIKTRMEHLGISQHRLQELTGILQHRFSEYLAGKRDMTGENLQVILDALGLEIRPVHRPRKEK
jgi:transcriptional regulator with XRE-family HTH domain